MSKSKDDTAIELSAVVRAHVDAFVRQKTVSEDEKNGAVESMTDAVFDLAGDVSNAITRSKDVQENPEKAKELVECIVKTEVLSRLDLPDSGLGVLQNILFRTLPRLIGEGASRWFKSFDADGDGRVSREEFAKGASASICCCCAACPKGQAAAEACCAFFFPCASCCCA